MERSATSEGPERVRGELPHWARLAREAWRYDGIRRPHFAPRPGPGQESVWDYPRPPRLERDPRRILVCYEGETVADTRDAVRVLETASPPVFYLPRESVQERYLEPARGSSACEWKGIARYWDVVVQAIRHEQVAWSYPEPFAGFEDLRDHISFYPHLLECYVDGERARVQAGSFYGGWITSELIGPFKGDPGTEGW